MMNRVPQPPATVSLLMDEHAWDALTQHIDAMMQRLLAAPASTRLAQAAKDLEHLPTICPVRKVNICLQDYDQNQWIDIFEDDLAKDGGEVFPIAYAGQKGRLRLRGESPLLAEIAKKLTPYCAMLLCLHHEDFYKKAGTASDAKVLELAQISTWCWDVRTDLVTLNQHASMLFPHLGRTHTMARTSWLEALHPNDKEGWAREMLALAQSTDPNAVLRGQWRILDHTKTWRRIECRAHIRRADAQQKPRLITGVLLDPPATHNLEDKHHALKRVLAERRTATQSFADLALASDAWLWEQDKDLRFTRHSRGGDPGLPKREDGSETQIIIGITHDEWLSENPDIRAATDWTGILSAQEDHKPFMNFVFLLPGDTEDSHRWHRISGAPIFDAQGNFNGYRGVGADVTELYLAKAKAESANLAKSTFLANMSHEIRTPLNGVLGVVDILKQKLRDPVNLRLIQIIGQSGRELLNILNDILDMSKIEAQRIELEQTAFNLADLARKIYDLHENHAQNKEIDFELWIDPNAEQLLRGDPLRVQQILHNLTSNAIKFTDEGSVQILIKAKPNRPILIEVQDTGIGMTEDQILHIYDEFSQADTTTTRRFGGTGLGMAITHKLVHLMGGKIDIQSDLGHGTTIRVELPLASA